MLQSSGLELNAQTSQIWCETLWIRREREGLGAGHEALPEVLGLLLLAIEGALTSLVDYHEYSPNF